MPLELRDGWILKRRHMKPEGQQTVSDAVPRWLFAVARLVSPISRLSPGRGHVEVHHALGRDAPPLLCGLPKQ
jgi:hypothetical protein